jgi:hypothetical protein
MKKIIYFILFVFLSGIFCTCKKYPEGLFISLRTAQQRLLGTWRVEKYLVDGIDSTASKYPMQNTLACYYSFIHEGAVGDGCYQATGSWEFNNGQSSLMLFSGNTPVSPLFLSTHTEWVILKLTNKKMHLKIDFSAKKYEIYFNKQKD